MKLRSSRRQKGKLSRYALPALPSRKRGLKQKKPKLTTPVKTVNSSPEDHALTMIGFSSPPPTDALIRQGVLCSTEEKHLKKDEEGTTRNEDQRLTYEATTSNSFV